MPARSSVVYAVCVVLLLQALPGFIAPAAAQDGLLDLLPVHQCMAKAIEEPPPATEPTPMGQGKSAGLSIAVGPDGAVRNVRITRGSGVEKLDSAALAHVRQHWRYQPLLKGCTGAEVRANIYFPTIVCTAQALRETHTIPDTEPLEDGQGRSAEMRVTVGADGKVQKIAISRSSGMPALDQAGMAHVEAHWRWQPFVCAADANKKAAESLETLVSIDFPVLVLPDWLRASGTPGRAP
jgi:TonB family protein